MIITMCVVEMKIIRYSRYLYRHSEQLFSAFNAWAHRRRGGDKTLPQRNIKRGLYTVKASAGTRISLGAPSDPESSILVLYISTLSLSSF